MRLGISLEREPQFEGRDDAGLHHFFPETWSITFVWPTSMTSWRSKTFRFVRKLQFPKQEAVA